MGERALLGLTVLVTRPAHQAGPLCRMIEEAGGKALRMPALGIGPPADPEALRELGQRLDEYDLAIFISPNAVRGVVRWLDRPLPPRLTLAAVGPATARALAEAGHREPLVPASEFNSEALLRLPELTQVDGKRVVIFRGGRGRGLLKEVLATRGARVEYAEAYRRDLPDPPTPEVRDALRRRKVGAVLVTSAQALEQLVAACADDLRDGLLGAQLVVSSGRMVQLAESLGFHAPLVAAEPMDRALVEALTTWRAGPPPQETD